ncbi:MAG: hypothetical protein U9Q75_01730, partial [Pseudomonadota bacterium]|nr:hypothetical protein [Pseudomonadota bacterium]
QELEEEERKAQQQHEEERRRQELEEEERKAQQQQEEERRRRELEGDERNAQQQEAERERQKLVAEKRRKQAQASRKRKICKESCSKRYQVCLKKSRPTTGDCSPQARKNCKNEHRKCLLDPQNTMIMGVSGVASHCNGQLSRCIKLKTAQCSGSKGSTGSECKKAFSSCKTACR